MRHDVSLTGVAKAALQQSSGGALGFQMGGQRVALKIDRLDLRGIGGAIAFDASVSVEMGLLPVAMSISGTLHGDPANNGLGVVLKNLRVGLGGASPPSSSPSTLANLDQMAAALRSMISTRLTALASAHGAQLGLAVTALRVHGLHAVGDRASFDLRLLGTASLTAPSP